MFIQLLQRTEPLHPLTNRKMTFDILIFLRANHNIIGRTDVEVCSDCFALKFTKKWVKGAWLFENPFHLCMVKY